MQHPGKDQLTALQKFHSLLEGSYGAGTWVSYETTMLLDKFISKECRNEIVCELGIQMRSPYPVPASCTREHITRKEFQIIRDFATCSYPLSDHLQNRLDLLYEEARQLQPESYFKYLLQKIKAK